MNINDFILVTKYIDSDGWCLSKSMVKPTYINDDDMYKYWEDKNDYWCDEINCWYSQPDDDVEYDINIWYNDVRHYHISKKEYNL